MNGELTNEGLVISGEPLRSGVMRASQADVVGAPLSVVSVSTPRPGAGEIAVDVAVCGLNFADTLLVSGRYQERQEPPIAPGLEVVGRIAEIGPGVDPAAFRFAVGDRVAAACAGGGLAERVVVNAAAAAPLPEEISDAVGAALPIAYATSDVALADRAALSAGERLLVTGAAGGVGLAAVEIGRLLGAEVVAVARGEAKRSLALRAGATVDFDADDPELVDKLKNLGGIDVAYETVGGAQWRAAFRAARPGARLLPIGFAGGDVPQIPANLLMVKNLTAIGFYWGGWLKANPGAFGAALRRVASAVVDGRLSPVISQELPLDRAQDGLDALSARKAVGKIVVRI